MPVDWCVNVGQHIETEGHVAAAMNAETPVTVSVMQPGTGDTNAPHCGLLVQLCFGSVSELRQALGPVMRPGSWIAAGSVSLVVRIYARTSD